MTTARLMAPPMMGEGGPVRGSRVPARMRIMGWLVFVMAAGLTTVVLLVAEFEYASIDKRINRELEQDAAQFRAFAARGVDPTTGTLLRGPAALFETYLRTQYTDNAEVLLGVRGTRLRVTAQVDRSVQDIPISDATLRKIITSESSSGTTSTPGGELRWVRVDVRGAAGDPGAWFISGYFMEPLRAHAQQTVRTLLVVGGIALALAAAVSWLVAGQILEPVRTVRAAAARLTERDLTHRIPVRGRDDIAALSMQFNAMLDRLEVAFRARRDFLDDAGHELRTPITIVRGHLELLGDDPAERAEVVRLCTDELDRMARIVDDMLLLAKVEAPDFLHPDWCSVPELTSDIDAKVRAIAARVWLLEGVGEGQAYLDRQRITQAALQLAQNAVQHTREGDRIAIGSAVDSAGAVSFWVADSGPGIAPEDAQRIFERFTRGVAAGREDTGAGLGLAIVKAIAVAHQGDATVVSQPGAGARFTLRLPTSPAAEGNNAAS